MPPGSPLANSVIHYDDNVAAPAARGAPPPAAGAAPTLVRGMGGEVAALLADFVHEHMVYARGRTRRDERGGRLGRGGAAELRGAAAQAARPHAARARLPIAETAIVAETDPGGAPASASASARSRRAPRLDVHSCSTAELVRCAEDPGAFNERHPPGHAQAVATAMRQAPSPPCTLSARAARIERPRPAHREAGRSPTPVTSSFSFYLPLPTPLRAVPLAAAAHPPVLGRAVAMLLLIWAAPGAS